MTLDQLIAEVAAQPTQVQAFQKLMECMGIELADASTGNSPPPSVKSKYDEVFSQASGKANEILNAIEFGKPPLEPVKEPPASAINGPASPNLSPVYQDKPRVVTDTKTYPDGTVIQDKQDATEVQEDKPALLGMKPIPAPEPVPEPVA